MQITIEESLTNFKFWSGAQYHRFTYSELKQLEDIIEDLYSNETLTDTDINDLFWFEKEQLCEWLNIEYEDDYLKRDF